MKRVKVEIKLNEYEKELWKAQAALKGITLSDYIRLLVNEDLRKS